MQPNEPTYHNNLGLSLFEQKRFEDALNHYQDAIKMETTRCNNEKDRSQENLSFYCKNLGLALYHMENLDEALVQYEKAI